MADVSVDKKHLQLFFSSPVLPANPVKIMMIGFSGPSTEPYAVRIPGVILQFLGGFLLAVKKAIRFLSWWKTRRCRRRGLVHSFALPAERRERGLVTPPAPLGGWRHPSPPLIAGPPLFSRGAVPKRNEPTSSLRHKIALFDRKWMGQRSESTGRMSREGRVRGKRKSVFHCFRSDGRRRKCHHFL